jgi:hypothetical protein
VKYLLALVGLGFMLAAAALSLAIVFAAAGGRRKASAQETSAPLRPTRWPPQAV